MDKRYEVHCFGTEAVGEEETKVMQRVQSLLKLKQHQLIGLFQKTDGLVLVRTDKREKALRVTRALKHAGVRAEFHDREGSNEPAWEKWSLQDKTHNEFHVFHCKGCNHSERHALEEDLPTICPKCGVVAAKYQKVADKKAERERIKRKVLDLQSARDDKNARAEAIKQENALRKEIEREVRRELGIHTGWQKHLRTGTAAIALLGAGAGGAIAWHNLTPASTLSPDPVVASPAATAPAPPQIDINRTLFLAEDLLTQLSGNNWQQATDPVPAAAPAPWLSAPATGSGTPAKAAPAWSIAPVSQETVQTTIQATAGVDDVALQEIVSFWHQAREQGLADTKQQKTMLQQLLQAGRVNTALDLSRLSPSHAQRRELLLAIAASPRVEATPAIRRKLVTGLLRDRPDDPLPGAMVLHRLLADALLDEDAQNSDRGLNELLGKTGLTDRDAVPLYATIATHRAQTGAPVSANIWFGEANRTLDRLEEPTARLSGLIHLARAYHDAGEPQSAQRLAKRVQQGIDAWGEMGAPVSALRGRLIGLLVDQGAGDSALADVARHESSALQRDLLRSELATHLGHGGRLLAARGVVATIDHPAARARALAGLSRRASMDGFGEQAQRLAAAAQSASIGLPQVLRQMVASELGEIDWMQLNPKRQTIDKLIGKSAVSDQALTVIASNLAWNQATEAALNVSGLIKQPALREPLTLRLRVLDQVYAGIAPEQPLAALD